MSPEILYRKVTKGKTVRYEPVIAEPETVSRMDLDEQGCLTAAGALGLTLLMLFERHMDKLPNGTPRLAERKIIAVTKAITDLYAGTGCKIDDDIADKFCRAWDKAMMLIASEEGV